MTFNMNDLYTEFDKVKAVEAKAESSSTVIHITLTNSCPYEAASYITTRAMQIVRKNYSNARILRSVITENDIEFEVV